MSVSSSPPLEMDTDLIYEQTTNLEFTKVREAQKKGFLVTGPLRRGLATGPLRRGVGGGRRLGLFVASLANK